MAFEVVWHPSASIDFVEVVDYVCQQFGWDASRKLYFAVMEVASQLSTFPKIGILYEGVTCRGNEVRVLNIHQNALVYAVEEKQITIIVFWDNRRNPAWLKKIIGSR